MKKQLLALLFSALMVVGFASVASAAAPQQGSVATIDMNYVASNLPEIQNANAQLQAALEKAQKTFQQSVNDKMSQQEIAQVNQKVNAEFNAEAAKIMGPVDAKVEKAIEKVAKANGYTVVIPKNMALYSAADISEAVVAAAK